MRGFGRNIFGCGAEAVFAEGEAQGLNALLGFAEDFLEVFA